MTDEQPQPDHDFERFVSRIAQVKKDEIAEAEAKEKRLKPQAKRGPKPKTKS